MNNNERNKFLGMYMIFLLQIILKVMMINLKI